jgi:F-type H+-transporting ATPase subunit delta
LKSAALEYANALADIALAQGAAEPAQKQLGDFGAAYAESAELRNFLASPGVPREAKHAVIEKIAARLGASKIVRNFLFVIVDNRRTMLFPEVFRAFQEVIRKRLGIAEAEVSSAMELSAAQKAELSRRVGQMTGQRVETKYVVDGNLLGGAVVRIGDTIYDGSVRGQLNALRAKLAE